TAVNDEAGWPIRPDAHRRGINARLVRCLGRGAVEGLFQDAAKLRKDAARLRFAEVAVDLERRLDAIGAGARDAFGELLGGAENPVPVDDFLAELVVRGLWRARGADCIGASRRDRSATADGHR